MPPDQDDNPFGRSGPWPKMPQAPFKIRSLTPTAPGAAPPEPPTQTGPITPVFTRPVDAPELSLLTRPSPALQAAPRLLLTPAAAAPRPAVPPPSAVGAAPAVAPAPAPIRELEPLIIQAPTRGRKVEPKRSATPVVVAGAIVLVAVATLVFLFFSRAGERAATVAAPANVGTVPIETIAPAPAATAAPPVAPAETAALSPHPKAQVVKAAPVRSRTRPTASQTAPVATPPAAEAAPQAAVLEIAPPPAAPPQPAYKAPAAPDPNAPVTTQRPY